MSDFIIETSGLRKTYGAKVAVADLTLQVPRGEVFGFLGPNGAGKSTAVKMLLGLVRPVGGQARVLGQLPGDAQTMARIGFLPEHFRFHEWMNANELLDLHGRLYGMDAAARRRRIPELLELVGLTEATHRQLSAFSKGMLQRIGLAQALLNHPDLVILDEPTSALDPFGRRLVRSIIHQLKDQGTTVFLNSHLLSEVEATCDRVSFIKEGRVLRTLSLHDLEAGQLHVELRVDQVTPALQAALQGLGVGGWGLEVGNDGHQPAAIPIAANASAAGVGVMPNPTPNPQPPTPDQSPTPQPASPVLSTQHSALSTQHSVLDLVLPDEDLLPAIAERTLASGARLYAMTPRRASLEQIFLEIVGTEDSGQ